MIDALTKTPLRVSKEGDAFPYIKVAVDQLPEVQKLLDGHGVRYWLDGMSLSFNGSPYKTIINLSRSTDPSFVQSLLDGTH